MTADEAAAHEVAVREVSRMAAACDAARRSLEQDADDGWIVSDRGFRYRIVVEL